MRPDAKEYILTTLLLIWNLAWIGILTSEIVYINHNFSAPAGSLSTGQDNNCYAEYHSQSWNVTYQWATLIKVGIAIKCASTVWTVCLYRRSEVFKFTGIILLLIVSLAWLCAITGSRFREGGKKCNCSQSDT